MQPEEIRTLLLSFPRVTEETPFGPDTVVYKTAGKMFALTNWDPNPLNFNLKCEPERALELRDRYDCVQPGYHMNKKHWNTVTYDGSVEDALFSEWITHSFECVLKSLPKKLQVEIKQEASCAPEVSAQGVDKSEIRNSMRKGI